MSENISAQPCTGWYLFVASLKRALAFDVVVWRWTIPNPKGVWVHDFCVRCVHEVDSFPLLNRDKVDLLAVVADLIVCVLLKSIE